MSDNGPDDLTDRIAQARARHDDKEAANKAKQSSEATGAAGAALRYSAELVAAVIVGLGLGMLIDHFAGTKPWGMLVMLGFGMVAGIRNLLAAAKKMNADAVAKYGVGTPIKDDDEDD